MRYTFRIKLMAILGTAAFAFVLLIVVSTVLEGRSAQQLTLIAERHIPQLELGPKLKEQFEQLRRGLQDAVSARDPDLLNETERLKETFLARLAAARAVIAPAQAAELHSAFSDYYRAAYDVSERVIEGQTGTELVEAMAAMQTQQRQTTELLERVTAFDQRALSESFAAAAAAQAAATRVRLIVSASCLSIVLLLSLWLSRGVLRSLSEVGAGFVRFGRGDFATPIHVASRDEFSELASQANQMAANLKRLGEERDLSDWIKEGHASLTLELRGALEPADAANRATRFLAQYLGAPAAALYWAESDGTFRLLGHCASWIDGTERPLASFRAGEGLIGQSAREQGITVLSDLPPDYFPLRSGLGQARPQALVLLPLVSSSKVMGLLELALFKPWTESAGALLLALRETLAITIEVARGRAALRELLAETQQQAARLSAQEDALRSKNEELESQQEELRSANGELMDQAAELEAQRVSLELSNAELRETRRILERKAQELATVSAYKSQFLANMSHELRTPLNSMLVLSNLLAEDREGNLSSKQIEFCRTIHGSGKDLLRLINQVLDLAKVESGKQEVHPELVRLEDLATYARRLFEPVAREKGLAFLVEVDNDLPPTIVTDAKCVEQILNNLLGNALKFTMSGAISLRIGRPDPALLARPTLHLDETVAIAVSDTGVGIAQQHQPRVFGPFEQLDAAPDRRYGGTGLGLSIARELAALLGGELQLRSEVGEGSTFTCHLPYVYREENHKGQLRNGSAAHGAPPPPQSLPQRESGTAIASPPPRDIDLLVIEGDAQFAELVGDVIAAQGLKCRIAHDGQSGLQLARECQPRGIILDVKLSDVDGFTLLERLQADPATSSIPVHIVSGLEAVERGLALGAVGYLPKPARRDDIVRVVESLTRDAAARVCRLLVVEDDADLGDSLVQLLGYQGFEARQVTSAGAALALLAKEHFSCLVLDLGLPDMDGLQFLQTLEKQCVGEMTPVLVYTARALSKAEVQRLEAYADAVVLKEGPAAERLINEVRLFARRLAEGRPAKRKLSAVAATALMRLEGHKILIADDDMRTVYALSALLRARGAEVLVADTGLAALNVLAEQPDVDLVLMDIMMPEMDGFEAMRRLRKETRFQDLPVIALTAKAMRVDREQCMQAGATDYLAKPIEADRLLGMVHARLSTEAPHAAG